MKEVLDPTIRVFFDGSGDYGSGTFQRTIAVVKLSRGIRAILGIALVAAARRAVERAGDERNIRALARQLGCSIADARRLYTLSREEGFGVAFQQIFPEGRPPRPKPPLPAQGVEVQARTPRHDPQIRR